MNSIVIGQRYMSEAEPELGLGVIAELEDKSLVVNYPAADETRRYGIKSAPLKRVRFEVGDEINTNQGDRFVCQEVMETESGLLVYIGASQEEMIIETDLLDSISFHHPEEKIINMTSDPAGLFELRQQTMKHQSWLSSLDVRGMLGARLSLIDHQLYLVDEITKRLHPRVLLADEVGLGKTIEAGLIIHRLLITARIQRVLIVVPNTLCYQWFVEMLRKYNLSFNVVNEQTKLEEGTKPFDEMNLVITSMQLLRGSEVARNMMLEANWDMLVVDEAHKLDYQDGTPGPTYEHVANLSKNIPGLLLLTATPEMFGLEGHFARLKLIDHDRFHDFEKFKEEYTHLRELADLGRKLSNDENLSKAEEKQLSDMDIELGDSENILNQLLDRHGTGRVYFRNTRKVMAGIYDFFPKRISHGHSLPTPEGEFISKPEDDYLSGLAYEARIEWLVDFLNKNKGEKVLLICRAKSNIIKIEKDLMERSTGNKIALFHSDLSLIARDRQAAFFSDPEGANILLCTEIGSEGRNFEFAHELILFDLPKNPDLLEQRIGRLDRIGQTSDINIHIPYLENSWEEVFYLWYQLAINAFEHTSKGGMKVLEEFNDELQVAFENPVDYFADDHKKLDELIEASKVAYQKIQEDLESGRDILIELNSFNADRASEIKNKICDIDESEVLKKYLETIFSQFGVDVEDLDDDSQYARPNENMFISHFPGLSTDGLSYTFNRAKALKREDLAFMSWDHPMVTGIIELMMGEDFGNATVATRKKAGKPKPFIEAFHILDSIAPKRLEVGKYLPPTCIRILMNTQGEDFSDKWSKEDLDPKLVEADRQIKTTVSKIQKSRLKELLNLAHQFAEERSHEYCEAAMKKAAEFFDSEIARLQRLQKINPTVSEQEIEQLKSTKMEVLEHIATSDVSLDSFRFIY